MKTILSQLKALEMLKEDLQEQLNAKRANQKFLCGCGKQHKFKDCEAVIVRDYVSPHGCTSGDYWYDGELRIICPTKGFLNRILFKDHPVWELREHFKHNAKDQFERTYLPLFKSCTKLERGTDKREWCNNYHIDKNHAKYGINITGENK